VEQEMLQTNPVLEAFGNSKTLRNNNSSRFGKWMEIRFDTGSKISAAKIVSYLLEKSRVVKQSKDERNYHVFYQVPLSYSNILIAFQLCSGGDKHLSSALYQELQLQPMESCYYLKQSGCTKIAGVDDANLLEETIDAFRRLKFPEATIENIIRIVAGVLHLGDLEFYAQGDGSKISNRAVAERASKVLGLSVNDLEACICNRTIEVRKQVETIPLNVEQASDSRHSASKGLYGRLFEWLITRINENLFVASTKEDQVIGVLDIFGFEAFDVNSFEQFCINFANEKLQVRKSTMV
jgi:myosin X